jgi:hypothetical protein
VVGFSCAFHQPLGARTPTYLYLSLHQVLVAFGLASMRLLLLLVIQSLLHQQQQSHSTIAPS